MGEGVKGLGMEGWIARSYEKSTHKYMDEFQRLASETAALLPPGSAVLEVAPGPGFLAVELAKRHLDVTALDISKTFVEIARKNAAAAGVMVRIEQGDAAHMPLPDNAFDFLICRAAFKNFSDPVGALREMRRVLKPGGRGFIIDLRRDTSLAKIIAAVYSGQGFSLFEKLVGRIIFTGLRRRAYTPAEMEAMLAHVPFARASVECEAIGMNVRFER